MGEDKNTQDIAVLQTEMKNIQTALADLKTDAKDRKTRQDEHTKAILARIDELTTALAKQQGFLNGAAFTVKAFWVAVGAAVAGLAALLATGSSPLK